ncbi:MAG TPA: translocation/assembly module TamB domain-containing protein [Burkholderiaceae bacterium]|nr:translocation/assembly module TamB domain-containing protein [Burkholderiaceae bacterium]
MSRRPGVLRRLAIWAGPVLMIFLLVVSGFVYWLVTTSSGARFALNTALPFVDGQAEGVTGSIWEGLEVERLKLPLEAATIDASDIRLRVNWEALLTATVQVKELSVDSLRVDIHDTDKPEDDDAEPFRMPSLPVEVQVDRVALGSLDLTHEGEPVPVGVNNLALSMMLDEAGGQVQLDSLEVADAHTQVHLDGRVNVMALEPPWPVDAALQASAHALDPDSPLCVEQYLDTLPGAGDTEEDDRSDGANALAHAIMRAPTLCHTHADLNVHGSLDALQLVLDVQGQGLTLASKVNLLPQAAFPFRDGELALDLEDGSSLHAQVDWQAGDAGASDRVRGSLAAQRLDVSQLVGGALPPALLEADGKFDVALVNGSQLEAARLELTIDEGSMWQEQALAGVLQLAVDSPRHHDTGQHGPTPVRSRAQTVSWSDLHVHQMDMDIVLGNSHIRSEGGFGDADDSLKLTVEAPQLASFWPDLPGGVNVDLQLDGSVAEHVLHLDTRYRPPDSQADKLGKAPIAVALDVQGGWHQQEGASVGAWLGGLERLHVAHAGLNVDVSGPSGPVPVLLAPMATDDQPLWSVGQGSVSVAFQDKTLLSLQHAASSGSASGQFKTAGEIPEFLVSRQTIRDFQPLLDQFGAERENRRRNWRGRVKVNDEERRAVSDLALAAQWDMTFYQTISGQLDVQRLSGDVVIPGAERIPLGLEGLGLQVRASPTDGGNARIDADLDVVTAEMGQLHARLAAPLRRFADGGFGLNPNDTLTADVQADIEDLAWVSLFTGDELDFGGELKADASIEARLDGSWQGQGTINGSDLKVVRIDDGMRLLDGTLIARLDNDQLILDELSFPASLRVTPKEARTAEWITTQEDAKDGWLKATGQWGLADMIGKVDVELHRFPVLQRADRFAMMSGEVHLDAALPSLNITGKVTADAGWFDLDMLGGVASVDGDVVVIRGDEDPDEEVDVPMDISMDIEVDLGPRFYLTGYGVDSGLVGSLRVIMVDNKLTGMGALRTRGGAIEAYGQRLQLRRGTVTFQGDIANPVLNIEALRTGLAVEAGVRVAGTGKKPRIDLVSYPDVSEVEKLSWLLFGHGPDESEGDMALLVSVGTAFLGGGEPFYRKFGIDEITLRSGEIGSVGSILPAESVVSGLNDGASELERQFIVATKALSSDFSVSVRQGLSDTGTVGRISYRLMRGVAAELSVGTVNGLAIIHRWFSRE